MLLVTNNIRFLLTHECGRVSLKGFHLLQINLNLFGQVTCFRY